MAEAVSPQPKRPTPPKEAPKPKRQPIQVMHISKKQEQKSLQIDSEKESADRSSPDQAFIGNNTNEEINNIDVVDPSKIIIQKPKGPIDLQENENITMADLLGEGNINNESQLINETYADFAKRDLDEFDFDEEAFLAALDENEPIGTAGEIAKGKVIGVESDGVYVDIGGKAPGFMPKSECGLGVITNIKERFPKGLEVEVLVTREQNADGMVTISCRALALRKSWEKVMQLDKEGKVAQVKINGFNRGGLTCDLEGLRGFIPRSQLEDGENYESLVSKTINVAFLEVNSDNRKLILSEKKATTAALFGKLKVGQLIEGKVLSVKPYGFFIDIGGISGLLHHSMITNGSLRSLREVFNQGDSVKALITELDPQRGRIGLNTALLENIPGEILIDKNKIILEAEERAKKARSVLEKEESTKE